MSSSISLDYNSEYLNNVFTKPNPVGFFITNDQDDLGKCFYTSVVFSMQALHQVTMAAVPASWALC